MNKIVQVRIYDVTTDTDNLHKKQMKKKWDQGNECQSKLPRFIDGKEQRLLNCGWHEENCFTKINLASECYTIWG